MEWMWEMKEREKSRMARATGVVGVPFIEGEAIGRRDLGEQEFHFGYIKFEMHLKHQTKDVQCTHLGF